MKNNEKKCGHYLGTEIEKKWWRRYKNQGFSERGIGEFWLSDKAFCFKQNESENHLTINLSDIVEIRIGKWHSGRWGARAPIAKIDWNEDGKVLSSGFVFSHEGLETMRMIQRIEAARQSN